MSAISELNSAPYFDDYSPELKDFLRVLFRPGYAVQARELNQLQSILQTQVERFGNHIFKEGSIVLGGMTTIDTKTPKYLKILDNYSGVAVIVSSIINREITGSSSGAKGYVVAVSDTEGADPKTLIYVPTNGINFTASETIIVTGGGNAIVQASNFIGNSSTFSIDAGIFFIKGFFVICPKQTTYLSKYSNVPNKKAGLLATISLFDEGDDETLLDNARGSYNYAAPGAHRLKINLTTASKDIGFTADVDKFIELLEVRDGQLYKQISRPIYSEIEKTLARRTYDESGDYTVKPFLLDVQNHPTEENLLRAYIEAGKAYVKGYEFETISRQYVDIEKARSTDSYNNYSIPLNYGNYVVVTFNQGFPDISSFETLNICNSGGVNSIIGTCKVASIVIHDSAASPPQYKLYLFNVALNSGNGIVDAREIASGANKRFTIVAPYTLKESDLQSYIFDTGYKSVSNLADNNYSTKKIFASASSNSSFSFSTNAVGKHRFQGAAGTTLDTTTKNSHYILVNNATGSQIASASYVLALAAIGSSTSEQTITISNINGNNTVATQGVTLIATINVTEATARVKTKVKVKAHVGTAQTGTSTTITLASTASSTDDFYNNGKIKLISGTGSSSTIYTVLDYVGATRVLTISSTFSVTPNATSIYNIAPPTAASDDLDAGRIYVAQPGSSAVVYTATGSSGASTIVVNNATGIVVGQSVTGTNIGAGATVSSISGTTLTLSVANTGAVANNIVTTTQSLKASDGISIIKIVNGTSADDWFDNSKDVTSRYIFDNGQRDLSYEYANITLSPGQTAPSGAIVVFFEYFNSSADGFFSVNSYPEYKEVPNFSSSTGTTFDLRNCIDFRPVKAIGGGYATSSLPIARTNMNADITYYLPRLDKIVATTDRQFKVIKGVSSLQPKTPTDISNGMTLYSLYLNPYTFDNIDIIPKYFENKNYTMRDIGKLEERINNIEYYSLLNTLEKDTTALDIKDAGGSDRYKNGFIVDTFSGHNIGDVFSTDYKCSIDKVNKEARSSFITKSYSLELKTADSSGYARWQNGPLLTRSFSEATFISQTIASSSINVNPFSVFSFRGTMVISPSVDYWKDEKFRPSNVINVNGVNSDLASPTNWQGRTWDSWQQTFQGGEGNTIENDRLNFTGRINHALILPGQPGDPNSPLRWQYQEINGIPSWVSSVTGQVAPVVLRPNVTLPVFTGTGTPGFGSSVNATTFVPFRTTHTITLGPKIVETESIPWMRSKAITFNAVGMKPNSVLYPFFDDINISSNVVWETSAPYTGSSTTNSAGQNKGVFTIPQNRFLCGDRMFRLSDSSTNNLASETTSAQARYTANGVLIHKQSETVNIRVPTSPPPVVVPVDPVAQTFFVDPIIYPEGLFLSSVDLFFKTRDLNIPVTVQIRQTVNGYPSSTKILPFAERTLEWNSVNADTTGNTATNFPFQSVVYLEPGEYCIVILANSNNYEVFVSEIGANKLNTNERISEQPYVGSLFKSQNSSTWTAEQALDLKFVLKRCNFTTGGNFTVILSDYPVAQTKTLAATGVNGASTISISELNDISVGQSVSGTNIGNGATITAVNGFTLTLSVANTGTVASNVTITGKADGLGYADVFWLGMSTIDFKNTSLSSSFVSYPVNGSLETTFTDTITNKNYEFSSQRNILAAAESFKHKLIGITASPYISPVIDMEKNVLLAIENDINNVSTNETNPSGGDAKAKYVTRKIALQTPADYLKIYLTAVRPSGTNIEVYYKVRNDADSELFAAKPWVLMSQESPLANVYSINNSDFKEYIFYPSVANYTTNAAIKYLSGGVTYQNFIEYAIKIVFKSSNSSVIPRISDFRGIALDT